MSRGRLLGLGLAAVVIGADQAAKLWILRTFGEPEAVKPFLPFVDLNLRLNPGVSFSVLPQHSAIGVALLLAFTLAVTAGLTIWLWRSTSLWATLGLGAIIGGALGNAIDRFAYGAVVDFLDLNILGRHFFVFNVADAAINVGVALLLIDGLWISRSARSGPQGGQVG